jgi:hypothetical protein
MINYWQEKPSILPGIWYKKFFEDTRKVLYILNMKGGDLKMADPKLDYKTVREAAEAEVEAELADKAKREYKLKLKELAGAEAVVKNIEREIEALDDKYS